VTTARVSLDDIIHKAADQPLEMADVDQVCAELGLSFDRLCDAISRQVARGYAEGRLSFGFCDGVMNHLYSYMLLEHDRVPPDFSYSVFLAFDEGEYQHRGDPEDSSPEDLYTKPMIAEILTSDAQVT
jgi:hypothetical protein